MADIERDVPRTQILQQFPFLAEWLESHQNADVEIGRRLMSPEERVERAGGMEFVRSNLSIAENSGKRLTYLILTACNQELISSMSIRRFTDLFGRMTYAVPTLFEEYRQLEKQDLITRRPVTYIHIPIEDQTGSVYSNTRGYIATESGLRERVRILDRTQTRSHLLGRFVPGFDR